MSTPGSSAWPIGLSEVEGLLDQGELETVEPSPQHSATLLNQARQHLDAATAVVSIHPGSAYSLLYEAARKALTAALAKQGLRATANGPNPHRTIQDTIEAQLGRTKGVVRPYRELRTRRHDAEYPELDTLDVEEHEARQAIDNARDIVDAMEQFVDQIGPFWG